MLRIGEGEHKRRQSGLAVAIKGFFRLPFSTHKEWLLCGVLSLLGRSWPSWRVGGLQSWRCSTAGDLNAGPTTLGREVSSEACQSIRGAYQWALAKLGPSWCPTPSSTELLNQSPWKKHKFCRLWAKAPSLRRPVKEVV